MCSVKHAPCMCARSQFETCITVYVQLIYNSSQSDFVCLCVPNLRTKRKIGWRAIGLLHISRLVMAYGLVKHGVHWILCASTIYFHHDARLQLCFRFDLFPQHGNGNIVHTRNEKEVRTLNFLLTIIGNREIHLNDDISLLPNWNDLRRKSN